MADMIFLEEVIVIGNEGVGGSSSGRSGSRSTSTLENVVGTKGTEPRVDLPPGIRVRVIGSGAMNSSINSHHGQGRTQGHVMEVQHPETSLPLSMGSDSIDLDLPKGPEGSSSSEGSGSDPLLPPPAGPQPRRSSRLGKTQEGQGQGQSSNHTAPVWKCTAPSGCVKTATPPEPKRKILERCNKCDKFFRTMDQRRLHDLKCHTENMTNKRVKVIELRRLSDSEWPCENCGQKFMSPLAIEFHFLTEHPELKHTFMCQLCKNSCPTAQDFSRHEKSHQRPQHEAICRICGKFFRDFRSLSIHQKSHQGQVSSPASSVQIKDMKNQSNKRSGEKRSICEVCGKQYASSQLRSHMETHLEFKKFISCFQCNKSFLKRESYQKHLVQDHPRTESGLIPCDQCNRKFSNSEALKNHKGSYHSQARETECQICKKTFANVYALRKHLCISVNL